MKLNSAGKISLAVLFLLITYWPISCFQYTMKYDMMDWFYPMRFLVGECLQNNVLPVWNPYTNLGYPLHVDPQSGALYPIVWVLGKLFGYSVYTINIEFIIHILLGFIGMKKLSEAIGITENLSIITGLSFACCGFFVGNAQHLTWIISAAWLPFVACYYYRLINKNDARDALKLSIVSFLLLTGGYPAFTIIAFYLMGLSFLAYLIYQLRKKNYNELKRFILNNCLFAFSFLLQSLVFLRFFLESLPFLERTKSLSLADVQLLPFSPQSFLSFVLPFSTGGNTAFFKTDTSMANGYFGIIAFLFVLLYVWNKQSLKSIIIWGLGIFFLLVSMGDYFFLRAWLYEYIPMMDLFRYPSLFRVFAILCFLLLFGLSMHKYQAIKLTEISYLKFRKIAYALVVFLLGLFIYALQKGNLTLPESFSAEGIMNFYNKSSTSEMVFIQAPLQILILSLLLFKSYYKKGISFIKFAMILMVFDLFLSVQLNSFLTIASEANVHQLQDKIDQFPKGFPLPEKKISDVSHHGNKHFYPIWYNLNILKKEIAHNGYNNFKLRDFRSFTKRADYMSILKNQVLFDSGKVEGDSISNHSLISITSFSPNKIEAKVLYEEDGEVALLQCFYPGWKAYLNDQEIQTFKKEGFFLTAKIPKGQHQLVFEYYPKYFLPYFFVSISSLILILLYLGLTKKTFPQSR